VDRTRIHLDSVDELGHFLELEVMLNDSAGASAGEASARSLMMTLGVDDSALVAGAFVDLLVEKDGQRPAAAGARSASATEP
jgi:adenylate cyclase class IV